MKKDIEIPEIKGVYMAAVLDYNEVFKVNDWNVYLINDNEEPLEMVICVSRGYDHGKVTAEMRRKVDLLPAKSCARIELMLEDILTINNQFKVTFFIGDKMYEKDFLFRKNTVNEKALSTIKYMAPKKGVMAELD